MKKDFRTNSPWLIKPENLQAFVDRRPRSQETPSVHQDQFSIPLYAFEPSARLKAKVSRLSPCPDAAWTSISSDSRLHILEKNPNAVARLTVELA